MIQKPDHPIKNRHQNRLFPSKFKHLSGDENFTKPEQDNL